MPYNLFFWRSHEQAFFSIRIGEWIQEPEVKSVKLSGYLYYITKALWAQPGAITSSLSSPCMSLFASRILSDMAVNHLLQLWGQLDFSVASSKSVLMAEGPRYLLPGPQNIHHDSFNQEPIDKCPACIQGISPLPLSFLHVSLVLFYINFQCPSCNGEYFSQRPDSTSGLNTSLVPDWFVLPPSRFFLSKALFSSTALS